MLCPDKWVVLKFSSGEEKLLCSWYKGFPQKDNYKLTSKIVDSVDKLSHIDFVSSSGNVYHCYKHDEGLSVTLERIVDSLLLAGTELSISRKSPLDRSVYNAR